MPNSPLRILVVDDAADNRRLLLRHLRALPVPVAPEEAENGHIALARFQPGRFDGVIMDIRMPEMDGVEAAAAMRRMESRWKTEGKETPSPTPLILISAENAPPAGADITGYLQKPISRSSLFSMLAAHVPALSTTSAAFPKADPPRVYVESDLMDLIPEFMDNRKTDVAAVRKALSGGDFLSIQRLAHTIKGLGGSFGFAEITKMGEELEQAAEAENPAAVAAVADELAAFLESVRILPGPE
jgi:CheY-like chemotaxis protein/HPt (histidine-containing phosphotransfer) domain-containing protein